MNNARSEILDAIRKSIGMVAENRSTDYAAIQREYRRSGTFEPAEREALFMDRLQDYGCELYRASEPEVALTVNRILGERGKTGLLVPPGLPSAWLPEDCEFRIDRELPYGELDRAEGVITGCALAIAVTGTIVLEHSSDAGRRALTLIPDYHLCIVRTEQIVETVPEGMKLMHTFAGSPITTISGSSATSDIEMTRIKGVHGPRTLDVLLVSPA